MNEHEIIKSRLPLRLFGDPANRKYPVYSSESLKQSLEDVEEETFGDAKDKILTRVSLLSRDIKGVDAAVADKCAEILQDSGFGEFEGSLNDQLSDISKAYDKWKQDKNLKWSWLEATFPDFVLVHQYGTAPEDGTGKYPEYDYYSYRYGSYNAEDKAWKIPYTYNGDDDDVSFGEPQEVKIRTIIEAIAEAQEQSNKHKENLLNREPASEDLVQTFEGIVLQKTGEVNNKIGGKTFLIEGIATAGDVENKKGQVYPWAVWQAAMPEMLELVAKGKMLGEIEHPESGGATLDRTVLQFTRLWENADQKTIGFEAKLIPTEPHGKNLQILIENGIPIDISSRGRGSVIVQDWNGKKLSVVQPGFKCTGFDLVVNGASPGSAVDGWQLGQSIKKDKDGIEEDSIMNEEMLKALGLLTKTQEALLEGQKTQTALMEKVIGNKTPEKPVEQSDKPEDKPNDEGGSTLISAAIAKQLEEIQQSTKAFTEAAAAQTGQVLAQSANNMIQNAQSEFEPKLAAAYEKHMKNRIEAGSIQTQSDLTKADEEIRGIITDFVGEVKRPVGNGLTGGHHWIKQSAADLNADLTPNQVIERMLDGVSDKTYNGQDPNQPMFFQSVDENGEEKKIEVADHIKTPKRQLRKMLQNIAEFSDSETGFSGIGAMASIIALEQGNVERAQNILDQSFRQLMQAVPTGGTGIGAGGAPASNIYIFPLIRRVFPQLILNEIASVQPMDRPEGKMFFLDNYRVETGLNETDENSTTISNRARIDLGSANPPNPDYADDPGEFEQAKYIQLRLSSRSVTAETKKLSAFVSIEQTQDLRAYHGLDSMQELMSALSMEMAMEWNYTVLAEMLAAATSTRTYGVTAPSGYTTPEWEAYLSRFINALSTDIYKKRNGEATHIICGADAWLAMSATYRMTGVPGGGSNPDLYAGLIFTPFTDGRLANIKVWKTNLWKGVNRNKILVIRRGSDWSDTPYVWSPYVNYTAPTLVDPGTFTKKTGIMERAAHHVVAGDGLAALTISNVTGTPIPFPTAS